MSGSSGNWDGILTVAKFSALFIAVSWSSFCVHRHQEDHQNYPAADGLVLLLSDGRLNYRRAPRRILIDHA
jgi:hypothetical protein